MSLGWYFNEWAEWQASAWYELKEFIMSRKSIVGGPPNTEALQAAADQGAKDAALTMESMAPEFRKIGEVMRKQREEERRKEIKEAKKISSQCDLVTLATAIREFVWAETRLAKSQIIGEAFPGEQEQLKEQCTRMETSMREQLEILNARVIDGQNGGRPHHRMR